MTDRDEPKAGTLAFESDPGAGRSAWVALTLVVALALWLGSGLLLPSEPDLPAGPAADRAQEAFAVAVRQSEAEPVTRYFVAEGQARPDRETDIRAEATGEIVEVAADKGETVQAGALIARIDPTRTEAQLAGAREELARARREFDTATTLLERGTATLDRVAQARAALAAAEAQLTAAQQAVADTEIRAPFAGRIEALEIDAGEFVAAGASVGRLLDVRPLTVTVRVPQQAVGRLREGMEAQVAFITGESRRGEIVFLGRAADAETRTFLAEIAVPNPDGAIPAGVSAEVRVPTGEIVAHFLSPAILSLGPEGALGVKIVDGEGRVDFRAIDIVRAESEGVWVTGLPDTARVITVGQGFVSAGERVTPVPEDVFGREITR